MRITYTSVFVSNQAKALKFYTEILGFIKKQDLPVGKFRWLTVVSPDDLNGAELLLEPNENPTSQVYQKEIFAQNIPAGLFSVKNVRAEHEKLKSMGVVFTIPPKEMGDVIIAVFNDTCGNLIQIVQT